MAALFTFFNLSMLAALTAVFVYLLYLLIRALRKYIASAPVSQEQKTSPKTLGEAIKQHRTDCNMTQEFVAEALGVSRQAVSKWESGRSVPSTANLAALAKLFGLPPEKLLRKDE